MTGFPSRNFVRARRAKLIPFDYIRDDFIIAS